MMSLTSNSRIVLWFPKTKLVIEETLQIICWRLSVCSQLFPQMKACFRALSDYHRAKLSVSRSLNSIWKVGRWILIINSRIFFIIFALNNKKKIFWLSFQPLPQISKRKLKGWRAAKILVVSIHLMVLHGWLISGYCWEFWFSVKLLSDVCLCCSCHKMTADTKLTFLLSVLYLN